MDFNPLWMLVPLLVLIFLGHPVGYVLGTVGMVFGFFFWGPAFLNVLVTRVSELQTNYLLVALPLFIFMGNMLERSGAADDLYEAMYILMGRLRGGLAHATIIICTVFAAATGVVGASVTAMGLLALPSMVKRGYDKDLAAGTVMAASCLGILIPPSIMIVVYGAWAGMSVGKLFMAAFLPGFLLSGLFIAYVAVRCAFDPKLAPPIPPAERAAISSGTIVRLVLLALLPVLFLIIMVLGTIFLGVATPTEAAGMGAIGSLIVALLNRNLTLGTFIESCYRTAKVCGMIAVIAAGALCFTSAFLGLRGAEVIRDLLLGLNVGPWGILLLMMLSLLIMGTFLDWFGILVIAIPIFGPIIKALGIDPIWFAALVFVNLQASFLTPPYGFALFYLKGITPTVAPEIDMAVLIRAVIPFITLQMIGLAILMLFPPIATWLPSVMIK